MRTVGLASSSRSPLGSRWLHASAPRLCTGVAGSTPNVTPQRQPLWFRDAKREILVNLSLNRNDRSLAGQVDPLILPLVEQVNGLPDLVTLSSCSGRVALFHRCDAAVKAVKKRGALGKGTLFQTHDPFDGPQVPSLAEEVMAAISTLHEERDQRRATAASSSDEEALVETLQLKFEPMIMHIMTWDMASAVKILHAASEAGQRRSGILAVSRAPHVLPSDTAPNKITVNVTSALSFDVPLLAASTQRENGATFVLAPGSDALRQSIHHWLLHVVHMFTENQARTARFRDELLTRIHAD